MRENRIVKRVPIEKKEGKPIDCDPELYNQNQCVREENNMINITDKQLRRNRNERQRYAKLPKEKKAHLLAKQRENYAKRKLLTLKEGKLDLLKKRRENYVAKKMSTRNPKINASVSKHEAQSHHNPCISEEINTTRSLMESNVGHRQKDISSSAPPPDKGKVHISFYSSFYIGSSSCSNEIPALQNQLFPLYNDFPTAKERQIRNVTSITYVEANNIEPGRQYVHAHEYIRHYPPSRRRKQTNMNEEGTPTNGVSLVPFKYGASLPKALLLPVILKYPYQRFSHA